MSEQQRQHVDQVDQVRRRRVGIGGFVGGSVAGLGFFAFFPGMPHVIDWGALRVSLAVGLVVRWGCRTGWRRGPGAG